jgi:hypothetical protein
MYGMFTVPFGNASVPTDNGGGGLMVMLSGCVTLLPAVSVTCTVNAEVPTAVGVPVISAEIPAGVVMKVSPGGRLPEITAQVNGAGAPVALTNTSYGTPIVPADSDAVVIVKTEFTVMDSVAVALVLAIEVAVMVAVVVAVMAFANGAVYTTEVVVLLPNAPAPDRLQLTP